MRCNVEHYGGAVVLLTLTAPGADLLPWACDKPHVHEGPRGCRVDRQYAEAWSLDCCDRLRRLRDAAYRAVKRAGFPTDSLWLGRVWEPQKRGVPHVHICSGVATPIEFAAAKMFAAELERRAPEYGFGARFHMTRRMEGRDATRYLAGYLLGRSRRKGTVRDNLADPLMPRLIVYVARRLTSETRVTMRRLRYARWYFAALRRRIGVYPQLYGDELFRVAQVCARLERSNGPPEPLERRAARHVDTLRLMRRLAVAV
jgi:hypothetical protein